MKRRSCIDISAEDFFFSCTNVGINSASKKKVLYKDLQIVDVSFKICFEYQGNFLLIELIIEIGFRYDLFLVRYFQII